MSLRVRQAFVKIAIIVAIVFGLLRPPFGSEAHANQGTSSHMEAVQHADDQARPADVGHVHDDDSGTLHDATDHCHLPSSLPPSVMALALSSDWTRLADHETASIRSAVFSFERPPKPSIFA